MKNYFFQSWLIFAIAIVSFLGFKYFLPSKLFPEIKATDGKNIVVDSLMLDAIKVSGNLSEKDTLTGKTITFVKNPLGIQFKDESFDHYNGYQHLIPYYEALSKLEQNKSGKIRIAYFGDSMNDGDMIVQDFRSMMQDKFGGEGVGFVSITSESSHSRGTILHDYSQNWASLTYLKTKKPRRSFGISGGVFFANDTVNSAFVKFKSSNQRHLTWLNNPTIFYGRSDNKSGNISFVNGKDTIYKSLAPDSVLNTTLIGSDYKSLKINFNQVKDIPFYGLNFDDGKGVHVDNFSSRGNSGLPLGTLNIDLIKAFHAKFNYNLIVLQFGTNVLNYGTLNYSWYEKKMNKVIQHLRLCFPEVPILIISTADKATKYDLEMKTDSAVVPLAQAQKRYAVQSESGFVNLYQLMGGDGSMIKWVEEKPAKAGKDYTHFNMKGSKEVAKLIFNEIDKGYQEYKKLRKEAKIKKEALKKQNAEAVKIEGQQDSIHE